MPSDIPTAVDASPAQIRDSLEAQQQYLTKMRNSSTRHAPDIWIHDRLLQPFPESFSDADRVAVGGLQQGREWFFDCYHNQIGDLT